MSCYILMWFVKSMKLCALTTVSVFVGVLCIFCFLLISDEPYILYVMNCVLFVARFVTDAFYARVVRHVRGTVFFV